MSLMKLEMVDSDEQNPDPIDKMIKLETLSSFYSLIFYLLQNLKIFNIIMDKNVYVSRLNEIQSTFLERLPGVEVISRVGFHSISPVSFEDEIDILLTVKAVKIMLPNRFARKVPAGYRFHPFKNIPRKWRLNPPRGARIMASQIIRFDGLNIIRQIPIIKSTEAATAGEAT